MIPKQIEVYGLGAIEFQVSGSEGLAVAGQPIGLTSVIFDTNVAEWIEAERIEGPQAGLATDVHGILRLQGLPRGPYHWNLPGNHQPPVAGLATVVADTLVRVPISVP
jgi:hypothetical protein